jgi:hypothetical protein
MFELPIKDDIDRALSTLVHEGRHRLAVRRKEAMAQATRAGALQGTRLIVVIAEAAEKIHVEAMQRVTSMLGNLPSEWKSRRHRLRSGPGLILRISAARYLEWFRSVVSPASISALSLSTRPSSTRG